eukprot:3533136-Karenia_brevis.AAC.1
MLFAKSLYNSGTWGSLNRSEFARVHSSVLAVYKAAFQDPYSDSWESDANLIARVGLTAPINLLRLSRGLLFVRLVLHGCAALKTAVCAEYLVSKRSWLHQVIADFNWCASHSDFFDVAGGADPFVW